jgi:hypothetical protein
MTADYLKIDVKDPALVRALQAAPIYQKRSPIKGRLAVPGERIVTVLPNGIEETVNVAKAGDVVVTNPDGESYILPEPTYRRRYGELGDAVCPTRAFCRAIINPHEKPIEIDAPWGAPEFGGADCLIADDCEENGVIYGEPYLIDATAFAHTYVPHKHINKL